MNQGVGSVSNRKEEGPCRESLEGLGGQRTAIAFYGYLSSVLSLLILTAAVIWAIYAYLPSIYYLPLSLATLVTVGVIAYLILNKRILT